MRWLGHPVSVVALAVLLVNDHLLKAAYPSWWTGKLSDAAGLVLAPPLLALVFRLRAWVAVAVAGAGFALLKSNEPGAALASAAWSLLWPTRMVADATDLLALPALGLSWWAWRTARPVAGRWTRAVRTAVLLPLALIGVAATSPAPQSYAVGAATDGPALVGLTSHGTIVSTDGGRTWQPGEAESGERPAGHACAGDDCYRVVPGRIAVEHSADGGATWATAWEVTELDVLERAYPDANEPLESAGLAVQPRPEGGHVVLVANQRDGFALRHTDGTWERIGFAGHGEDTIADPSAYGAARGWDFFFGACLAVTLACLTVGLGAVFVAFRLRRGAWHVLLVVLLLVPPVIVALHLIAYGSGSFASPFGLMAAGFAGLVAFVQSSRLAPHGPPRWLRRVWLSGLVTAAATLGAVAAWVGGLLGDTMLPPVSGSVVETPLVVWLLPVTVLAGAAHAWRIALPISDAGAPAAPRSAPPPA